MKLEMRSGPGVEIEITGDGSHTLFVPETGEHYHSIYGAIAESRHIFLEAGFKHILRFNEKIRILEIGFGTGLNALLTYIESEISGCFVEYTAIELFPLKEEVYSLLNYCDLLNFLDSRVIYLRLHNSSWNKPVNISPKFSLLKRNSSLQDYLPEKESFDLVYFDAFGPDIQPEMWTGEVFDKMAFCLRKNGVLVTYSTKGTVKRNLKSAGFRIEKLPGPKGKREILRAVKI
jgi:tRNA U34 5-methylaminomethyl-2-thiouridine-forming methyltransferase MnmC